MIIDGSTVETGEVIDADLCIVGAGPAGLTLAREYVGSEHRVYILDTGDLRVDERSRELAAGDIIGHPYFPLDHARGFAVGGSSHLWTEWMRARPLDRADLAQRPWVAGSGWPLSMEQLKPYYGRAAVALGLGDPEEEVDCEVPQDESVRFVRFRYSNTFDFERVRSEIAASANVCLVVNATALELIMRSDGQAVERVLASSANPQRFEIAPRIVVLSAGGVETPRLLLLSRGTSERGAANSSGLVGRYFMEHPTMRSGIVHPGPAMSRHLSAFRFSAGPSFATRGALVPTEKAMERNEILNCMVMLTESDDVEGSEVRRSLAVVRDGIRGENELGESVWRHVLNAMSRPLEALQLVTAGRLHEPTAILQMSLTVEQAPNLSSAVTLSDRSDSFGRRRAALDWRLGGQERHTVRVMQELVARLFDEEDMGRVHRLLGTERPPRRFRGEWHQLGTTRMSKSGRSGVVDPTGRTHDVRNLYVAGGATFPTVGYANPTLTIVALTLRLADCLETPLGRQASLGPIW